MYLRVCSGHHNGWVFRLEEDSYTLGRNRDNDLILLDRWISRQHCVLSYSQGAWHVADLGSTHGVSVNGQRIDQIWAIAEGDEVALGEVILKVSYQADPPPIFPREVPCVDEHPVKLTIRSREGERSELTLKEHAYTIGRTRSNSIVLQTPTVSRRHAIIGLDRDEWFVMDLNSRHGVLVDGEPVDERMQLAGEESIMVGGIHLSLSMDLELDSEEDITIAKRMTPKPLVLAAVDGLNEGWEIPLTLPMYTVGRSRCNNLTMADPSVSRIHGLLIYSQNMWSVDDVGSSMGIFVNNKRIAARTIIRAGMTLRLGETTFHVRDAFSRIQNIPAELPAPTDSPDETHRSRQKLRILQTVPDMEQTIMMDGPPPDGMKPEHPAVARRSDLEETFSNFVPADEEEPLDMMRTISSSDMIAHSQAKDRETMTSTYDMHLPDAFREMLRKRGIPDTTRNKADKPDEAKPGGLKPGDA